MFLSSVSSNHRLSNDLNVSLTPPGVALLEQSSTASGSTGDRRLSELYAGAIRQATLTDTGAETLDGIPEDSRFGEWWQQLFNATHSPVFLEWAKSKNIDTSQPININPYNDELTVTINGERTVLRGSEHGSAWHEATGPAMAAVKVLSNSHIDAPISSQSAPLIEVAHFYGEVLLPYRKKETLARATHLEHNQGFDVLGPDTYVDVEAQSFERLQQQKGELGDSVNKFTLLQKLREIRESNIGAVGGALASKRIPTHPDSSYRQDSQRAESSVADLLAADGWHVPENQDELDNLIRALAAPALPAPANGNFGGALAWPEPMAIEDQAELFRIVTDNQPPLPGLDGDERLGSADVLSALVKQVPRSVLRQGDPNTTVEWILDSSLGQRLGEELKKRLGEVAKYSTAQEVLLTALAVTLDAQSLDEPKLNHVAGFNLATPEFSGQPLSVIKQGLIDHLVQTHKTTAEAAPLAAMLLLSRAAPELLVKDLPASVAYGSFAWLALKSAVGRIEATSPGASARMTFAEVIAFDAIDPVTDEQEQIQQQTQQPATLEWGKLHGLLPMSGPYSAKQMADTRLAISTQQQAMLSALNAFVAPVPTQRSVALAELKARFGEGIPFEEKSIRSHVTTTDSHNLTPSITLDPVGSYSLLDLYLAKKAGLGVGWHSSNAKITKEMIEAVVTLPDPIEKQGAAFDEYAGNLSHGWSTVTKNLISNLPVEDRKNIESGKLTVYQRGESVRTEVTTPNGSHSSERFASIGNDRSLIIKTERNGLTVYYEFDPQRNVMRKRDDWKDSFKEGLQGPEVKTSNGIYSDDFTAPAIQRLKPSADSAAQEQAGDDSTDLPKSFSSNRSEYLGTLLSDNIIASYQLGALKDSTRETTTFDKEAEKTEFMRNLVLGVIPGGAALWNLANGRYIEAAGDVIFDVVMYATTAGFGKAGGAAKGVRAVRRPFGKSLANNLRKEVASSAARLHDFTPGLRTNAQPAAQLNKQQLRAVSRRADLVEGTVRTRDGVEGYKTLAKFDHATGTLYAFDLKKNRMYGPPLNSFEPAKLSDIAMQNNVRILYKKLAKTSEPDICYAVALRSGQAEKVLSPKVFDKLMHNAFENGYPSRWKEAMGITPERIQSKFDPADMTESGVINFFDKRRDNKLVHTAYIQKTADGKQVLYNTNQLELDLAMLGPGKTPNIAGRSAVYSLEEGGAANLQQWLDKGYDFSFTPASEINKRVASWPW